VRILGGRGRGFELLSRVEGAGGRFCGIPGVPGAVKGCLVAISKWEKCDDGGRGPTYRGGLGDVTVEEAKIWLMDESQESGA